MQIVYSLTDARLDRDSVVTIGSFDGIHRGHRAVIDSVRRAALERQRASVVVTFFPHPGVVLGRAEPFYLTSTDEKIEVLSALGIDVLVVMTFTIEMSRTRAADYVSMLVEHLRLREVHLGYDFAFGHNREGTVDFLERSGVEQGFDVRAVEAQTNGGQSISSTGIRQALRRGDVETAARWLGRPFRLSGAATEVDEPKAVHAPLARLDVWPEHAIPANGVYACWAWIDNLKYKALVKLGEGRDATGQLARTVEARLVDSARRVESAKVRLDFVARLRGESAPDAMVDDIDTVRGLLE
jgi:riboflavin kinase/FMN adenylyltransferase